MSAPAFVAHHSRGNAIALLVLSAGMVAGGLWLLTQPELELRLFGGLMTFFFAIAALLSGRQLGDPRSVIEVDARGLMWRRWSAEPIPWLAIERAALRRIKTQRYLCLWLREPAAHRPTTMLGRMAGANKLLGFGDVAIDPNGTDRDIDELAAAVGAYVPVEPA